MNFSAKKSKTRSCLQPHRQPSSTICNDALKYVIIDSQNEEQLINMKQYDSVFQGDPFATNEDRKSVIMKSKGSTIANFLSNQNDCEKVVDKQIFAAEKEVSRLKKQCDLIQKMITDMIEEQAKIQVSIRKVERRQSLNKQVQADDRKIIFSNYQTKVETQASSEVRQILQSKLCNANYKTPIYMTTPMTSQIIQKQHKKSMEIVKTVQISSKAKLKRSKENISTHKKIKTMKSIPKLKYQKSRKTMDRRKSKVF